MPTPVKWKQPSSGSVRSGKRSSSPGSYSSPTTPRRQSSSSGRRGSYSAPRGGSSRTQMSDTDSRYTPVTAKEMSNRETKVERRRLQAEAKAHKLEMLQQKQQYAQQKRMNYLDYSQRHKEVVGVSPATKYGIMAGIAGVVGYIGYSMLS